MPLKEKTVHGAKWVMIDNFFSLGVVFLISIVLARLLTPADYGLIGMTVIFTAILNVFVEGGLSASLIRSRNVTQKDFTTVFYFNLAVCLICYLLIYFGAPAIAFFYKQPVLTNVIRLSSLSLIINGLSIVQHTIRVKEINFKIQAIISIISHTIGGITGIALAYNGFGVWSIVWQTLVKSTISTSLFWLTSKWRPRLYFSKRIFFRHFRFGIHILKSNLMMAVVDNFYYLVIGKFYAPALLGQFTRAEAFINLFTKNIYNVSHRIVFPVLCSINNDRERLHTVFYKFMAVISFVSAYFTFMLVAVSDNFIPFIIGPQWNTAVIYLKILATGAFFFPLRTQNIQLANVLGRSDLFVKAIAFQRTLTVCIAITGALTNIEVLVYGYTVSSVCSYIYNAYQINKVTGIHFGKQMKLILSCNWITFILAFVVFLLGLVLNYEYGINFLIQFVVACILSFVAFETLKPAVYMEVKSIVVDEIVKIIKR